MKLRKARRDSSAVSAQSLKSYVNQRRVPPPMMIHRYRCASCPDVMCNLRDRRIRLVSKRDLKRGGILVRAERKSPPRTRSSVHVKHTDTGTTTMREGLVCGGGGGAPGVTFSQTVPFAKQVHCPLLILHKKRMGVNCLTNARKLLKLSPTSRKAMTECEFTSLSLANAMKSFHKTKCGLKTQKSFGGPMVERFKRWVVPAKGEKANWR
eukprot:GHVN01041901.1.p1 GENE.GHVN01041901.1~~GHVN01041901.1.p1  ORF type:complete len:209 (-),score=12.76 GHVN01041901.1:716-1342(-)